jgi:hypothetical protein
MPGRLGVSNVDAPTAPRLSRGIIDVAGVLEQKKRKKIIKKDR